MNYDESLEHHIIPTEIPLYKQKKKGWIKKLILILKAQNSKKPNYFPIKTIIFVFNFFFL